MTLANAARRVRRTIAGRTDEAEGFGTGLAEALHAGGGDAIAALFADGSESVELSDDAVTVRFDRVAEGAEVTMSWPGGESARHFVALPRHVQVHDLTAALHDRSAPLSYRDGAWFAGPALPGAELYIPPMAAERLGSAEFRAAHGLRYAYVAGAMAGGIGSPEIVAAMARGGGIGFFGAGGLPIEAVVEGVRRIRAEVGDAPCGFNLLHNPAEPAIEERTVDCYLEHGCRTVSASAYMGLTAAVVRFRLAGITEVDGQIHTPNHVLAKVSRPEVAEHFLKPAPIPLLEQLVRIGALTSRQAELALRVPIAMDITPEADSGGHTDRRPLSVLVPLFRRLRDRIALEQGYTELPRIGAAGGIGDPWALAGALQLGADYVLTGSINQATIEAGTSTMVKEMLAQAAYADVSMGPAPDMFELGANVQVLSRGSMYAQRATRLYELYKAHPSIEYLPAAERERVEKQIFQRSFDEVWSLTEAYWAERDPRELEKAARDSRHKMALCFRWYLGLTSRWARLGDAERKRDFQIWCGPAMGLFNDWVRGTWLEPLEARSVVAVSHALLDSTCVALRVGMVRAAGLTVPASAGRLAPIRR